MPWLPTLLSLSAIAVSDRLPYTVPEATAWRRTSTCEEVDRFLGDLRKLPHADRLHFDVLGTSHEGRTLPLVLAGLPVPETPDARAAGERLRILVNANIHAGEVEGKEAVQMILRELCYGEHEELLRGAVIAFVPIYNADGNERIDRKNRVNQNGPDGGVGVRENAQGLDLNRDFVKAETPECAALLALMTRFDPHVFMDLHTTNGSAHGYHLTYATSLSTNVDPEIDGYARDVLLPAVRAGILKSDGFRVFDYGNFYDRGGRSWVTYDHRPRFGTNYVGLRNRVAVLSEAYSNLDLHERVDVTRAFVLETVRRAVADADRVRALCAAADARVEAGEARFPWATSLGEGHEGPVLVGEVRDVELEGLGTRHVAEPVWREETMQVRDRFVSEESEALPQGWVLPHPTEAVREALRRHGLWLAELVAPARVDVLAFEVTELQRARREFQGHFEVSLSGAWSEDTVDLPAGAWIVTARQPLGRVAAQLLEPRSEDSLATWNLFDDDLAAGEGARYPVLRLRAPLRAETRRVRAHGTGDY